MVVNDGYGGTKLVKCKMLIMLWQTVCWEAPPGIKEGGEKQQPSEAEGGVSEREGEDQEPQVKSEHLAVT